MSHPVVAGLTDSDPAVRREACRQAATDPSAVLLVDALGDALGDPDASVGRAASDALAALSPTHDAVRELLRAALHDDHPRRRFGAALTSARLAPPEPGLLPALVGAMADADAGVRWLAARIFVDLGRLHREALSVAIGLARTDPNPRVRRMAVFCIAKLAAPGDDFAADALRQATRDVDDEVRRAARLSSEAQKISASSE